MNEVTHVYFTDTLRILLRSSRYLNEMKQKGVVSFFQMESKEYDDEKILEDEKELKLGALSLDDEEDGDFKSVDRFAESKEHEDDEEEEEDCDEDIDVEREWKNILCQPNRGQISIGASDTAKEICEGLRIVSMSMSDGSNGEVMWTSGKWGMEMYEEEKIAHIPARILQCKSVAREIVFSSKKEIKDFRLEQRVFLGGVCIEEWHFKFGFVIPGSQNSWQQQILSASDNEMLSPEEMSGKLTIETGFYDGSTFISKALVRIYYDQ